MLLLKHQFNMSNKMNLYLIFLTIYLNLIIVFASYSGVYIDDGLNTIMHRELDEIDKKEVEHEILQFLGLPDRPRHGHLSIRKSAPQFLLDAYHRLNEEEMNNDLLKRSRRETDNENFITDLDKIAIDQSDIIMTFLNRNHHVSGMRHEHGRRLWFDISGVSNDAILMMAELRIFQNPIISKYLGTHLNFIITVYSIIKNEENEKELEILSTINTTTDYHGWLEMNVTEGLENWLKSPKDNKGLYISAHTIDRPDHEIKLDDIGIVNIRGEEQYQPFMIGFFKGPEIIKNKQISSRRSRKKRNTNNNKRNRNRSDARNPLTDRNIDINRTKSCQIQTLYINFKDLSWHDWIIAPEGYSAFYCSGECSFPLNAHMNATNHAIVQTLVHLMYPTKVPKPCCAPTVLGSLPVLYHLNEENVNLKKYKNMVVKSCGCH